MKATLHDLYKELWLRQRERGEIRWKTKEGKEIDIKEMSDKHLENTIRLLENIDELQGLSCEFIGENFGDR